MTAQSDAGTVALPPRHAPTLAEAESRLAATAPSLDRWLRLVLATTIANPEASGAVLLRVDDALAELEGTLAAELADLRQVRRMFAAEAARRAA